MCNGGDYWSLVDTLKLESVAEALEFGNQIWFPLASPADTGSEFFAEGLRCDLSQQSNAFFPDGEVAGFLGSQWILGKMRNDALNEVTDFVNAVVVNRMAWPFLGSPFMHQSDGAAGKKHPYLFKDGQVVRSKCDAKSSSWIGIGAAMMKVWLAVKVKASFAVGKSGQPVSKNVAVDVRRERRDRIGLSHDWPFRVKGGCG